MGLDASRGSRALALLGGGLPPLVLPAILVTLAVAPGGLESGDASLRLETAESWLEGRGGALRPGHAPHEFAPGLDGRPYGFFGPLQPLLFAGLLSIWGALGVERAATATKIAYGLALLPLLFGLLGHLARRLLLRAGAGERAAFWGAAGLLFLTPLLHYARIGQEENLLAVAYAALLLGAVRVWNGDARGWALLGLAGSAALATRVASLPTLAAVLVALAPVLLRDLRRRDAWPPLGLGALLLSATAAVLLLHNQRRFGSPFEFGYGLVCRALGVAPFDLGRIGNALPALLLSPARGVLPYAPILVGLAAYAPRALAPNPASRRLAILGAAVFLANLLFFGSWAFWHGGFGWGPRFLVAPLVFLAPFFTALARPSRLLGVLAALSLAVQALSVSLPGSTEDFRAALARESGARACGTWDWGCSALGSRPALAGRALANTLTSAPLPTLREGEGGTPAEVLASSDFRALNWWPVRAAYHLGRGSPAAALGVSFALLGLGLARLLAEWRRVAAAEAGAAGSSRSA